MATSGHLWFAQRATALAALVALSACQSNGLNPTPSGALEPPAALARAQGKVNQYTVSELATLGGTFSLGNGINNRGWITGVANLPSDASGHAARWTKGEIADLGTLGGPNSFVGFPNKSNAGNISGGSDTTTNDPYSENFCADNVPYTCLPFDWRAGVMHALPTLGGNNGVADANNSAGDIVGYAETATKDPSCTPPQVFDIGATRWDRRTGHVTQLPALSGDIIAAAIMVNDSGDAVGGSGPTCASPSFADAAHPVIWHRHGKPVGLATLGGAISNFALSINNRGDIVGLSDLPGDTASHAVLWKKGSYTKAIDLGTLSGDVSSQANGINSKGQIVGFSCDASGNCRAVLWENGSVYDLNTLIPPSSNLDVTSASDINNGGVIVGQAVDLGTGNLLGFEASPNGKMAAPASRPKAILPAWIRKELMRHGLGGFRLGLNHP
jgi:probable HAF family extracellular repeat protein